MILSGISSIHNDRGGAVDQAPVRPGAPQPSGFTVTDGDGKTLAGANIEKRFDTKTAEDVIGFRARCGFGVRMMYRDGVRVE